MTVILWPTWSCVNNVPIGNKVSEKAMTDTLSSDDYKIINSTIVHLVITPPPGSIREFGYDNFTAKDRTVPDGFFRNIFFTNVMAPLIDTLVFNHSPNHSLELEDSSVQELYNELLADEQKELIIEMDSITNTGFWKLTPVHKGQRIEMEIGVRVISYSRIVYNTNKTKAIFYFQKNCSGLCGLGMFVVVEKVNGIWTIINEYNDWVS